MQETTLRISIWNANELINHRQNIYFIIEQKTDVMAYLKGIDKSSILHHMSTQ